MPGLLEPGAFGSWNFGHKGGRSTGTARHAGRYHSVYVEAREVLGPDGKGTGQYEADIMVYSVAGNKVVARERTIGRLSFIRERAVNLYNREESGAERSAQAAKDAYRDKYRGRKTSDGKGWSSGDAVDDGWGGE